MDNKETLKQNNSRIDINNTDLSSILITINNLPVQKEIKLQEKSITPSTEEQSITADEGYTGLSKVTVAGTASAKITDAQYLFYNGARTDYVQEILALCENLTNTSRMFYGCRDLENVDISKLNTSNVTDMNNMFYACYAEELDVSNFKTSNVTNMNNMFEYCVNITSLDVSNFDISNVTDISRMFYSCRNLTSLDLSSFDTSKVTNMDRMFYDCKKLTKLDIRSFTFDNVTSYYNMFYNVPANCEIIVKGDTEKEWVLARRSDLTNVKTVAELEV